MIEDKLVLFAETLQNNSPKNVRKGCGGHRCHCCRHTHTHSSRPPRSDQSPFPVHGWESSRLPTLQTVRTITGTIYGNFFFFFKFCTDSSIYPLLMLHSFVTRRSSLSHQSEGKHVPFVKTGGIHCEGLSGMRGLRSGRCVSLAANPRWRSGYPWRCVLWRRAGLWGCGIARLRSSTFAVERRKCISGAIYSSWYNNCSTWHTSVGTLQFNAVLWLL